MEKGIQRIVYRVFTVAIAALLLAGCNLSITGGDESGSSSSDDDSSSGSEVTLLGTLTLDDSSDSSLQRAASDYTFYCVTFSNPASSGSGTFVSSGAYSLSISNASDVGVGCLLNHASSGGVAATVLFEIDDPKGFGSEQFSSVSFAAGDHEVNVEYDPAGLIAIATIVDSAAGSTESDFDPEDMVGTWNMACSEDNTESEGEYCEDFLDNLDSIFIDALTAQVDGETAYAMAVWRSKEHYEEMGSTEGMASVPDEVESLESYLGNDPSETFTGFQSGTDYDTSDNEMSDTVVMDLVDEVVDDEAEDQWEDMLDEWYSSDTESCPTTYAAVDTDNEDDRACFWNYLKYLAEKGDYQYGAPKPDDEHRDNYVDGGGGEIRFEEVLGSPNIRNSRQGLLEMQLIGDNAVGSDFKEGEYEEDGETCNWQDHLSISFSFDDNVGQGRFTQNNYDSCDEDSTQQGTFVVDWTRP